MAKVLKEYCVFPEHIERCHFTKEEYENLWWDQDDPPNSEEEGGIYRYHYEFEQLFDSNDPGLISGYTTEMYMLTIYSEEATTLYPLVKRLISTNPPEFRKEPFAKRHLTKKEIAEALKDIKDPDE